MDELFAEINALIEEIQEGLKQLREELSEYAIESDSLDQDAEKLLEEIFSDCLFDDDMIKFISDEDSDELEPDE